LFTAADAGVLLVARRLLLNHRDHLRTVERLRQAHLEMIRSLSAAIDARNPFTQGHSERVARIAARLGQQMGLPASVCNELYLAGLLHDIGMVAVPDTVLHKPEALTDRELELLRQHTLLADRLLSSVPTLGCVRAAVRSHHERHDGKGYPDGLAGEAVPLPARILAVADACEAMTADRPYRAGLSSTKVDAVLLAGAGRQWNPDVVAVFMTCRDELYAVCAQGRSAAPAVAEWRTESGPATRVIRRPPAPAG
jgi:HD-GYP domain-containing protein (c-di-GMP phosphodiesterase class II)